MSHFQRLSPTTQGYLYIIITMCVWGSFSLLSRLNLHWGIAAWDILALRFGIASLILLPVLIYQKNLSFLWQPKAVLLAIIGGIGYSSLVYSAFLLAPVVHGAVFLNGTIPIATALLMWLSSRKLPDRDTKIALSIILFTLLLMMILMMQDGLMLGIGDILFIVSAFCWSLYGLLLKNSGLSAWQVMCSTAIWSAIIYLPIYFGVIGISLNGINPIHIAIQGIFHSIIVMIFATITYALAIERLGAFLAGGIASLAPFIAAVLAVPLLHEPLNHIMLIGLIGMSLGVTQPWRLIAMLRSP